MTTPDDKNRDDQVAMVKMFEHMATYGGGPAHPIQMQYGTVENGAPAVWFSVGLTKREHISAMILQSMVERDLPHIDKHKAADEAIAYADALLEKLRE
jgi:hypothetical protein